ncbi:hypothetical protein GCM10009602_46470 [Nocardiopsis tropica]
MRGDLPAGGSAVRRLPGHLEVRLGPLRSSGILRPLGRAGSLRQSGRRGAGGRAGPSLHVRGEGRRALAVGEGARWERPAGGLVGTAPGEMSHAGATARGAPVRGDLAPGGASVRRHVSAGGSAVRRLPGAHRGLAARGRGDGAAGVGRLVGAARTAAEPLLGPALRVRGRGLRAAGPRMRGGGLRGEGRSAARGRGVRLLRPRCGMLALGMGGR